MLFIFLSVKEKNYLINMNTWALNVFSILKFQIGSCGDTKEDWTTDSFCTIRKREERSIRMLLFLEAQDATI